MKRFLIDTSVENAEGTQTWFVDAENEQEALDKFSSGNCDLYESNVEVTRCGEPEISGEVQLDDFGRFAEQPAAAQPAPVPLTARELELIDGMIEVQLDHAKRCDSIANRTMAERQKGWDMERVALLQKLKEKNNG